ncbi:ArsR/SmtB family transcription factor [Sinomonas humi]|uniref:ArsR/SmtB family transcription factor n=1 Tax=Sinomonas humi TaxID=1338436 RepID=UPI000689357C|nr:metalloregulator ArsR/SmtB family transcription factor [Sinomonas humi]
MKLVGEDNGHREKTSDLDGVMISVHPSACYDFIVSARALFNPDVYKRAGHWIAVARNTMAADLYRQGRPFFEGGETALGLGLLRLIPTLKTDAVPADFIELLRSTPAEECALMMLDTGETPTEALDFYRSVLNPQDDTPDGFEKKTREFAGDFADRSLEVLQDPSGSKERILRFLQRYLETVFGPSVDSIREAVERAAASSKDLLAMQPAVSTVEALTGGYTLSAALRMNQITLAPSVFIYPFMASRVDERSGEALIVFGIKNDEILGYRESGSEDLLDALKALSNSHRLQILTMLRDGPLPGPEFIRRLGLSQPTVHHHLAQLRSSGLIRQVRSGEGMLYSFRPDAAETLVRRLQRFLGVD